MKNKKVLLGLIGLSAGLIITSVPLGKNILTSAKEITTDVITTSSGVKISELDSGYKIENDIFSIEIGQYGEMKAIYIVGDSFKTNYVMNEIDNPKQATAGHQWLGELMFRTKIGNQENWQKEYTSPSSSGRKIEVDENKVIISYENATEENAIKNLKVVETYELVNNQIKWSINVKNTQEQQLTVGDFGIPLPFREYWTYDSNGEESPSTTAYEGSVVDHSFVGQDASYIYATRPSGMGDFLVMTPEVETGVGFEYQDHWIYGTNNRTEDEKAWCMDQEGWANGLNVFYIHSEAIKEENKGYLENTALVLEPGEDKTYTFNFNASNLTSQKDSIEMTNTKYEKELKSILYQEGIMDAVSVPGMIISKDASGKANGQMYLHTKVDQKDISFDFQCMHNDMLTGGTNNIDDTAGVEHVENGVVTKYLETKIIDNEQYHIYDISFSELGNNNIIVNYSVNDQKKKTTLQYYIIDNPEQALALHSEFMLKTQWDSPGELQDKVFDDWMMNTKSKRGEFGGYWGWGDDWGLVHGTYLAEMNSLTPNIKQVQALDEYLDTAIWNGLMQEHQEDYFIHDFLMEEPNNTPIYRGFAYPHIYNTYFAMYKIAKNNPELIKYKESADTYLLRAYNILNALYKDGVGYNWNTGVMGEVTTPEIIKALDERGFKAESENIQAIMEKKYNNFTKDKYPYVSEYPYDNTSEEAIYMLASLYNDEKIMAMVDLKTRACRGVQPIWYHYGNPTTICGENWFNFQYTASLAGSAMDDWLRTQNNKLNQEEIGLAARANYAGKISNLVHINSGQISSEEENIGTVSWTYQSELGNYEALGTGGGKLQNGWRQMSGEADLALFGALQILSADIVEDPVFDLIGYGASVSLNNDIYTITPKDGLRQRINLINEQISYEFNSDKYTEAKISSDGTKAIFDVENITKEAHDLTLNITNPKYDESAYEVYYGGKQVGSFIANQKTVSLTIPITDKDEKLEIKKGKIQKKTKPEITLPKEITVTLDEARNIRLLGKARDSAWLHQQANPEWSVDKQVKKSNLLFSDMNNEVTTLSIDKVGKYKVQLSATGQSKSTKQKVTINVVENEQVSSVLADYDFELTEEDIIVNTIQNQSDTGFDSMLKGNINNTQIAEGKTGKGLLMNGKIGGYIQLSPKLTQNVEEATISLDIKSNTSQIVGTRILEFGDLSGNLLSLRFATENELELVVKNSELKEEIAVKTGVAILNGLWRNLEITVSNDGIYLYCDGNIIGSFSDNIINLSNFDQIQRSFIGRGDSESSPWFNGVIDNFYMMSKALNKEEIQEKYGSGIKSEIESLQQISLVTSIKVAPNMPTQVIATYNDGTSRKVAVSWDEINENQYSQVGEFSIKGHIENSDLETVANINVVKGTEINLATLATPSAIIDSVEDLGGVAGLNDGFNPTSSGDTSHGVWHNWLGGNQSGESWIEYTWENQILVIGMDTYYFYNGSNFAPSSIRLQYLDEQGNWQSFENVEGAGVALDQYNTTKFNPVYTNKVRMYMTPINLGTGVIEWKVYGYSDEQMIDKKLLSDTISIANGINFDKVTDGKEKFSELLEKAKKVQENKNALQSDCDSAAFELLHEYRGLWLENNNLAYLANVNVSYISPWESQQAINDGLVPESSTAKTVPAYGTWGNISDSEIITYKWATPVEVSEASIYFWTDKGGILMPQDYTIEYLDEQGNWQIFGEKNVIPELDIFNMQSQIITTKQLRLIMRKQENNGNGVGVFEWQSIGTGNQVANVDVTKLQEAIYSGENVGEKELYTEKSWNYLVETLQLAIKIVQQDYILAEESAVMITRINDAIDNLEKNDNSVVVENNIAVEANISGSFEDANDLGGYAVVNDQQVPKNSNDISNGAWHNWNGREIAPYIEYTWGKEVSIEETQVYFFSDNTGIRLPESYSYQYLDTNNQWIDIEGASDLVGNLDVFNKTPLQIKTKSLRMIMNPQKITDTEFNGVGILEWKVNGKYVDLVNPVAPEKLDLNITGIKTLKKGKTLQVVPSITPIDAETVITWSFSNPEIASIDENNEVIGLKVGTTIITGETSNGKKANFTLRVTK